MARYTDFILLVLIMLSACRPPSAIVVGSLHDPNYKVNIGSPAYVVDTVIVAKAYVFVNRRENIMFLSNNPDYLARPDRITADIYNQPDVYLVSHCYYCHFDIDSVVTTFDYDHFFANATVVRNDEILVYRFNGNNDVFILSLMNINYYNNKHSSSHGSVFIPSGNNKSAYVRVLFPFAMK